MHDPIDTGFLQGLIGYNARRASLAAIELFHESMAAFGLKPVEFSVLSVIAHNAGITSRQLCAALGIRPPNLVGLINQLEKRELLVRKPHPSDGRAMGLHLTASGRKLARDAERTLQDTEQRVTQALSPGEVRQLIRLLQKVYQSPRTATSGE